MPDQQSSGIPRDQRERDEAAKQILELRLWAEKALEEERFQEARGHIDRALMLDPNDASLREFREAVDATEARAEKLHNALTIAHTAQLEGDLDAAKEAAEQALNIAPDNAEGKTLLKLISREIQEREHQQKLRALLTDARQEISSRRYAVALETLLQAESLDPNAPEIQSLRGLAENGQKLERRRKELDALVQEIQAALESDDYRAARDKSIEGLSRFPEERALLNLKNLAERQVQLDDRKRIVEQQLSAANQLLQEGRLQELRESIERTIAQIGSEPRLESLLAMIEEHTRQEDPGRRRKQRLTEAAQLLNDRAYESAISVLEELSKEFAGDAEIQAFLARVRSEQAAAVHDAMSRAEQQPALALRMRILEEALRSSPNDAKLKEYQSAVQRIVKAGIEAQKLEEFGQYDRALAKWDAIRVLYPDHPDLKVSIKRLRGLQEQAQMNHLQEWIKDIREAIDLCDYTRASALLSEATNEFAWDADLMELRDKIQAAHRQRSKAKKMIADAERSFAKQEWESGLQTVIQAEQLVGADPEIRDEVVKTLAQAARDSGQRNAAAADQILRHLANIQPESTPPPGLQTKILKIRREDIVARAAEQARRKQISGDLDGALQELENPLILYPNEQRLLDLKAMLESHRQEIMEMARLDDLQKTEEAFVAGILNQAQQSSNIEDRIRVLEDALRQVPQQSRLQRELDANRALLSQVTQLVAEGRALEESCQFDSALLKWQQVEALQPDYLNIDRILDENRTKANQVRHEQKADHPGAEASPRSGQPGSGLNEAETLPESPALNSTGGINDTLDPSRLAVVEQHLATFLGPLAKVLVRRSFVKTTSVTKLYQILASYIESEQEKQAFIAMRGGLQQDYSPTQIPPQSRESDLWSIETPGDASTNSEDFYAPSATQIFRPNVGTGKNPSQGD